MSEELKRVEINGTTIKLARAWYGKLTNINNLLCAMDDLDILTKSDQAKKSKVFYRYYRWFNDGDMPRLTANGIRCYKGMAKEKISATVEDDLNKFIKYIFTKYAKKINRHELIKHYKENSHY